MPEPFRCRPTSHNSAPGFTVVELLVAALIAGLLATVLFYSFSAGEHSLSLNAMKIDQEAEVRRTMEWILRDVRQAVSWDMASVANAPSDSHIKFRKVEGWDAVANTFLLANNYTEYTYNISSKGLTRRLSDLGNLTVKTWQFNRIIQPPFYTRDVSQAVVSLNSGDLITSRKLVITITGQEQFRNSVYVNATLTSEVKIRNE